jgi:dipeptidyl aminopeptidase/acylaminoacyl peptidase
MLGLVTVLAACGGGNPAPAATVTVTASASPSATATSAAPSPRVAPSVKPQLVVAVASGAKANGVSVVNGHGVVEQLVAPGGGPVSDLAWSPDGTRLAFLRAASQSDSTTFLFVYETRTGMVRQVPVGVEPATIDSYAWVSATRLIASYFPAGAKTYRANGKLWLRDVAKGLGWPAKDAGGHPVKGSSVSASADGTRVAFVSYGAPAGGVIPEKLHVYDTAALTVSTVATGEAPAQDDGDQFTWPVISPDGSMIATEQTGSDIGFGLTVYAVDGTERLTANDLVWPARPAWTAQGQRLAFGGAPGVSGGEVDSLNTWTPGASAPVAPVTGLKRPVTGVAWTPKASQIAYAVSDATGLQSVLWIAGADGSNPHVLIAHGSSPAWAIAPIAFP